MVVVIVVVVFVVVVLVVIMVVVILVPGRGHVHTCCPSTVPKYDYRWALLCEHTIFFKNPPQNSGKEG